MTDKWLYLYDLGGDPWILPIWKSMHVAIESGRVSAITPELREIGLHVSTRLTMFPPIIDRLNEDVRTLFKAAKRYKPENVSSETKDGVSLKIDYNTTCWVIASVDSLLFETNSCAELMGKFFQLLHNHSGDQIPDDGVTKRIRSIFRKGGVPDAWFKKLDQARNFVAHNGTFRCAIDISEEENWKAIFLKEDTLIPKNNQSFVSISDLQEIVGGFVSAKVILQNHLVDLFKS